MQKKFRKQWKGKEDMLENTNNLTSNQDLLISSSNSSIPSLSAVVRKKRNDISRKTLVVGTLFFLIISIVVISFVISIAVQAAKVQSEINDLENEIYILDEKVNKLESNINSKFSNNDIVKYTQENNMAKTNGRVINYNDNSDLSIAYNTNIEDLNSFMSVIVNALSSFWKFLY